ncbi:MAG: hypothetical protein QM237_10895 [Bacteroidota bacterium]|jgi:predicted RNase H-like nuclease (RuvC/YqgF family)|nr:hypothetical protein [Bacteroidota bacterium]HHU96835.1 hypothetical protein [Petrimonas sp.]
MILNLLLSGGLIVTLATLRSVKREANASAKKAEAQAKASEIENVEAAVKIWRELAEEMEGRQKELSRQVDNLSTEVKRLKNATNRVARLLDRITTENMAEMVQQIRDEIQESNNNPDDSDTCNSMPSATGDGDTAVC